MWKSNYNKYSNKKTIVEGITFDSKREASRYCELKLLERAKEIKDLRLQVVFVLCAGIKYIADFTYWEVKNPEKLIVEDVKGVKTDVYKLKKKLLLYKYHTIDFREI